MAVPFNIDYVWLVGAFVFWNALWMVLGFWITSMRSGRYYYSIGRPTLAYNMVFYYILVIVLHIPWIIGSFMIYIQPDPLAPTVPGGWVEWPLPLAFGCILAPVYFLYVVAFWYAASFLAAAVILTVLILLNIATMLIFWLVSPAVFVAGIIQLVSIILLVYFAIVAWLIWYCMRDKCVLNLRKIWFCTEVVREGPVDESTVGVVQNSQFGPVGSGNSIKGNGYNDTFFSAPLTMDHGDSLALRKIPQKRY